MSKKVGRFASPWPGKLRELNIGESLLVDDKDLNPKQVRAMLMNMHSVYGEKGFFFKVEQDKGVSLITRITDAERANYTKYGLPYKVRPKRKYHVLSENRKKKAPAADLAPVAATAPHVPHASVAGLAPKPILVLVVRQRQGQSVPYIDWQATQQFATEEETKEFLDQCARDPLIMQARIYTFSHRLAKQVQWSEI